jgi:antitoxin component of RelBE/YafQ-DinJ toxin-antitoxin module
MSNTTRVTVDFPNEEHKRLKAVAALMGMSIKDYIILCVEEKIFSKNIPNKKTKKVFEETDRGKNLTACENVDDMIEKLGLNK